MHGDGWTGAKVALDFFDPIPISAEGFVTKTNTWFSFSLADYFLGKWFWDGDGC